MTSVPQMVTEIDAWLDAGASEAYRAHPLAQDWARVSKVAEELGEVTSAFIACTGQNPRKGRSGGLGEVLGELADVALAAIFAVQHFTKDPEETERVINDRLLRVYSRLPQHAAAPPVLRPNGRAGEWG